MMYRAKMQVVVECNVWAPDHLNTKEAFDFIKDGIGLTSLVEINPELSVVTAPICLHFRKA